MQKKKSNHKIVYAILFTFLVISCGNKKTISEEIKKKFTTAKYHFVKGEIEIADKLFDEILTKHSDFFNARIMKVKALYYLGKFNKALKNIEKIQGDLSNSPTLLYWKAKNLKMLSKRLECVNTLKKILEMDPFNVRALYDIAKIYKEDKKYKEALRYYREIIIQETTIFKAKIDIVEMYGELKFFDKAKKMFQVIKQPFIEIIKNKKLKKKYKKLEKLYRE